MIGPRRAELSQRRRRARVQPKVTTVEELRVARDTLTPMLKLEKLDFPPTGKEAEIISGAPEEVADKLAAIMKDLGVF